MENTATTLVSTESTPAAEAKRPVLVMTAAAVAQVKQICKENGFEEHVLTVRVVPAGCSGLGYDLNIVKEAKPGDTTWEQDGLKVATDGISLKYLTGTEMDYVKNETAAGFKFSNPNAKSTCGCGTSFSA